MEWFTHFLDEFSLVKEVIFANWDHFLLLAIFYTGVVVLVDRLILRERMRELNAKETNLKAKEKELNTKKEKYAEVEKVANSPEYKAFLLARGVDAADLIDSTLFK